MNKLPHHPHLSPRYTRFNIRFDKALQSFTAVKFPIKQISYHIFHKPHISAGFASCPRCQELSVWFLNIKSPAIIRNQTYEKK